MGLEYVDISTTTGWTPTPRWKRPWVPGAGGAGKALYAGLSNYNGETLEKACAILDELHVPFVINQKSLLPSLTAPSSRTA